jgi:hypothetical protein
MHQVELDRQNLERIFTLSNNVDLPRLNLNIKDKQMVRFSSDLVYGLNLDLHHKSIFGNNVIKFKDDITYNRDQGLKFKEYVTKRKSYLEEESNYFNIEDVKLTKSCKATSLINTRVILFYRNVNLVEIDVKRILTLGLAYLTNIITRAELFFEINNIIPKGRYEVTINAKEKSYVLIGIEPPVF